MKFLKQLSFWAEKNFNLGEPKNTEEAKSILKEVLAKLDHEAGLFEEIMETEADENSEVLDLARMLQLLNHEDEFYQEQGIALLLSYDSREAWDALMVGISFENRTLQHSSLKLSPALRTILFQNPYYDYSDIKVLEINEHFENLEFLHQLSGLEELQLVVKQKCSLRGIEKLAKLKRLFVTIINEYKEFQLDQKWTQYFTLLDEIGLWSRNAYLAPIDYSFVDSLPNLKKLSLFGFQISYENAQFRYQPELTISSGDTGGNAIDYIRYSERMLPKTKMPLQISELYLSNVDPNEGLDLSFLERVQVDKLILHKQKRLQGLPIFQDLPYQPEIQCIDLKWEQKTWREEVFQQFGAENLKEFLENKEKRKEIITNICNQEKLVLQANEQGHPDMSVVRAKEVQFIFPNQDGHRKNRKTTKLMALRFLPKGIQKMQLGVEGQDHGIWLKQLAGLEQYTELRELICINFMSLSLNVLGDVAQKLPKLQKIIFIGGKKRPTIPKSLKKIFEYRES